MVWGNLSKPFRFLAVAINSERVFNDIEMNYQKQKLKLQPCYYTHPHRQKR